MKTKLVWCKMSNCLTEIAQDKQGSPICFLNNHANGNVCWESKTNFIILPNFIRYFYGLYMKIFKS